MAQLLSEAHTMRNQTAMTYARGKAKAKKNNLKRFMDECAYLKQRNVLTLSDFESYLSSVDEKWKTEIIYEQKQQRMKELRQMIENAKVYTELKPVAEELKTGKYRFAKAREKYKTNMKASFAVFIW